MIAVMTPASTIHGMSTPSTTSSPAKKATKAFHPATIPSKKLRGCDAGVLAGEMRFRVSVDNETWSA